MNRVQEVWRFVDAVSFPVGVAFVLIVASRTVVFAEPIPAPDVGASHGPSTADTITSLAALVTAGSVLVKAVTECLRTWRRLQRERLAAERGGEIDMVSSVDVKPSGKPGNSENNK